MSAKPHRPPGEFDTVRIIAAGWAALVGMEGAVVDIPQPGHVTVELADEHGRTVDLVTLPAEAVEVIWTEGDPLPLEPAPSSGDAR